MYTDTASLSPNLSIGVLRGGPSLEYENSLKSGEHILRYLNETHRPLDIFISRDGVWHIRGVPRSPERILKQIDVIFNALHGSFGEDGGVQEILNTHGALYTGSNKLSSGLAMNKWLTKERAKVLGIKTPISVLVRPEDIINEKIREIFNSIPYPLIVKPATGGWSKGLHIVKSSGELEPALLSVLSSHPLALVEEKISGKDVSCLVTDDFREQKTYAFPPIGQSDKTVLSKVEKETIENVTKKIHQELGLSHYSESDFIVSPRRGVYFLEVNTLPDISEKSSLIKSLETVGVGIKEFLYHLLSLALNKK
ncbi:MAG: ATP-grasp domain-containing protein [Candidatus Zambryskibacteria bacterium]|nr:ATP-grasp domain-containing protein [Candidatus Zambryskibacteria bacterium]